MNKQDILKSCETKEEKMFVSHIYDVFTSCEQKNYCIFSDFLDENEQTCVTHAFSSIKNNIMFSSKTINSQRKLVSLKFDYFDIPTVIFKIINLGIEEFSHKDILGALMNLGIKRQKTGDITEINREFFIEVKEEISDFLLQNLEKIRYSPVKLIKCEKEIERIQKFEELFFTVSSLRLDCVISAVCGFSREKAKQYITFGNVKVNHTEETDIKKQITLNDVISIKKYGRFIYSGNDGLSRKDKHKIIIKKYI